MRRFPSAALAALLLTMPAVGAAKDKPSGKAPRGVTAITEAELRDYLTFLSADDMEGRDTPSRGLNVAANFIATHMSRWGLKPAGDDGTWFQKIALTRKKVDPEKTTATLKERRFTYGTDFVTGVVPGTVEGPMVYVGHGYQVKAKNIDAYKGIDVKGKIVIAHAGLPPGVTQADLRRRGGSGEERPETPMTYAAKHGARGLILIPDFQRLAGWKMVIERLTKEGAVSVDKFAATPASGVTPLPSLIASPDLVRALFQEEKSSGEQVFKWAQGQEGAEPFDLKKTFRFDVAVTNSPEYTRNVVAILEGSDPKLKSEYIAIGAHYDHVGTRTGEGDKIFNGADDDGSGTTAVLAIAEAFAKLTPRPKRSLLFVWHAGEEQGLWGSDYVTRYPPVPIEQIVTQLNIDMIGRSRAADDTKPANKELTGPNEIYVIGSKMMSTDLGAVSEKVNDGYLKLSFNYKYDDPKDPNRFFFRSDHYNYARKGVPIIFYFSGVHEDYHRVTDSVEKIDFTKMEKVTRTVYATALALADAPAKVRVDKKLPQELTEN